MSASSEQEIKLLKAQLRGMDILLRQNAQLEREVSRLCGELDEVSAGIQKKGFLHKWREREISYASRWGLRYFTLVGHTLCYYADDHATHPRGTFDLRKCFVRDEGPKGQHFIFSIYTTSQLVDYSEEGEHSMAESDSLLIRLSSENAAEARLWVRTLELACAAEDTDLAMAPMIESRSTTSIASPAKEKPPAHTVGNVTDAANGTAGEDWRSTDVVVDGIPLAGEDAAVTAALPPSMLSRVKSSSAMLRKSSSKQSLVRRLTGKCANEMIESEQQNTTTGKGEDTANPREATFKGQKKAKHHKAFPGYKPMHLEAKHSPLSSEARPGEHNFRGFFNLSVIILILSHLDLVVNNLRHHGTRWGLPNFSGHAWSVDSFRPAVLSVAQWSTSVLIALAVEKLVIRRIVSNKVAKAINIVIGTANLLVPCYYVWTNDSGPFSNMTYLFQSVVIWMKMISYAHANSDLRALNKKLKLSGTPGSSRPGTPGQSHDKLSSLSLERSPSGMMSEANLEQQLMMFNEVKDVRGTFLLYPQNVTLRNIAYFALVPTLCYQLNYPRNPRIRWKYLLSILLRLAVTTALILYTVEQYIKPTLETSLEAMHSKNVFDILEGLLKLSIPNSYVWLLGFYWFFHLWMNFFAEITCFGDRTFYKDWWNARTIDRYWRTWNMPVHNWITRHLYYPLIRSGVSKFIATFLVFLFSAVFHELIIALPFRYIAFHAFTGMLFQAPLIYITKHIDRRFDNAVLGNIFFWLVFCVLGQPMGVIMYNYDLWKVGNSAGEALVSAGMRTCGFDEVCM